MSIASAADMDFLSSAVQLGLGGVALAGIIYITVKHNDHIKSIQSAFLKSLDERADKHEAAMAERERALRTVEADVRKNLTEQLTLNTLAMQESTKIMERVVRRLDGLSQ